MTIAIATAPYVIVSHAALGRSREWAQKDTQHKDTQDTQYTDTHDTQTHRHTGQADAQEGGLAQEAPPAEAAHQGMHLPAGAAAAAAARQRACDLFPDRGLVEFPDHAARLLATGELERGCAIQGSSDSAQQHDTQTHYTQDNTRTHKTSQADL